jgi:prevent-host-death family protein
MREVAVYEAKSRLSELLLEVENGGQITITRRGVPIARLVSATAPKRAAISQRQQVGATFERLKALREGVALKGKIKDIAAEGRD